MRPLPLACLLLLAPVAARADCQSGVARAMHRANALPPTAGRAALLEKIQRADVDHHEGDDEGCRSELQGADEVLDKIDAAKRAHG